MADKPNSQEHKQLSEHMKWLVVMLCIMLGLSTIAICNYAFAIANRIWDSGPFPDGAGVSFLAVIAATFGILITGVFVFMTFRIDRGAVIEARTTAQQEANQTIAGCYREGSDSNQSSHRR